MGKKTKIAGGLTALVTAASVSANNGGPGAETFLDFHDYVLVPTQDALCSISYAINPSMSATDTGALGIGVALMGALAYKLGVFSPIRTYKKVKEFMDKPFSERAIDSANYVLRKALALWEHKKQIAIAASMTLGLSYSFFVASHTINNQRKTQLDEIANKVLEERGKGLKEKAEQYYLNLKRMEQPLEILKPHINDNRDELESIVYEAGKEELEKVIGRKVSLPKVKKAYISWTDRHGNRIGWYNIILGEPTVNPEYVRGDIETAAHEPIHRYIADEFRTQLLTRRILLRAFEKTNDLRILREMVTEDSRMLKNNILMSLDGNVYTYGEKIVQLWSKEGLTYVDSSIPILHDFNLNPKLEKNQVGLIIPNKKNGKMDLSDSFNYFSRKTLKQKNKAKSRTFDIPNNIPYFAKVSANIDPTDMVVVRQRVKSKDNDTGEQKDEYIVNSIHVNKKNYSNLSIILKPGETRDLWIEILSLSKVRRSSFVTVRGKYDNDTCLEDIWAPKKGSSIYAVYPLEKKYHDQGLSRSLNFDIKSNTPLGTLSRPVLSFLREKYTKVKNFPGIKDSKFVSFIQYNNSFSAAFYVKNNREARIIGYELPLHLQDEVKNCLTIVSSNSIESLMDYIKKRHNLTLVEKIINPQYTEKTNFYNRGICYRFKSKNGKIVDILYSKNIISNPTLVKKPNIYESLYDRGSIVHVNRNLSYFLNR